jgi:Cof subfamily protein (haloacid dehalogenase superfamily)
MMLRGYIAWVLDDDLFSPVCRRGNIMKRKIVFFDIDGTLMDGDKKVPESTKQAIQQLADQDTFIAIATGRAPFMFTSLLSELNIDSFVSFNGQYVVHRNEVVLKNPLNREQLTVLEEKAKANKHPMVFLDHLEMKANEKDHSHIRKSLTDLKLEYPEVDSQFYQNREIYQALVFCKQQDEHCYNGKHPDFDFIRWHDFSMDVIPTGGSKAKGVERLLDHLSMNREDAIAFGDALNDIEMLKYVGTGIAMGNAMEEAKAAADYITKDVSDNGILYGLKAAGLLD